MAILPGILGSGPAFASGFALSRTLHQVNQVVGLLLGGVCVTLLGPTGALLGDALSYGVSYVLLAAGVPAASTASADGARAQNS